MPIMYECVCVAMCVRVFVCLHLHPALGYTHISTFDKIEGQCCMFIKLGPDLDQLPSFTFEMKDN